MKHSGFVGRPRLAGLVLVLGCAVLVGSTVGATSGRAGTPGPSSAKTDALRFDERLLAEINTVRRAHGLAELRLSHGLGSAALFHSSEMVDHGFFAHTSADGRSIEQRITSFYPVVGFRRWEVGETLSWSSPNASAIETVTAWLRSPAHRSVILGSAWRDVGVAAVHVSAARGAFGGRRVTIITADFGYRNR
jgi:uncharacterized protein YkwD